MEGGRYPNNGETDATRPICKLTQEGKSGSTAAIHAATLSVGLHPLRHVQSMAIMILESKQPCGSQQADKTNAEKTSSRP